MKKIKVSIILSFKNGEKYLKKCLDNFINQDFQDMEIIAVNINSTDKSLEILENYLNCDERIKVINLNSNNISEAKNVGFQNAKGDYVLFFDIKNSIEKDFIKILFDNANSNNSDVVEAASKENKLNEFKNCPQPFSIENATENILKNNFELSSALFKKEFLNKNNIKFSDINNFENLIFYYQTFLNAKKITAVFEEKIILNNKTNVIEDVSSLLSAFEIIDGIVEENKLNKEKELSKLIKYFYIENKIQFFREFLLKINGKEKDFNLIKDYLIKNNYEGIDFKKIKNKKLLLLFLKHNFSDYENNFQNKFLKLLNKLKP